MIVHRGAAGKPLIAAIVLASRHHAGKARRRASHLAVGATGAALAPVAPKLSASASLVQGGESLVQTAQ